jgi:outer membrane protein OmpA-like peptidoglycan-associated protein/ABC-type nitrate/sulfonate/bicarbonate transport system substrate-binding protein
MTKLTSLSKALIAVILLGAGGAAVYTHRDRLGLGASGGTGAATEVVPFPVPKRDDGELIVALSEWPGHMALVVANGGLTTQPGSPAAELGAKIRIVFIEDAAKKNKALMDGTVDFVWQTVDELPVNLGAYRAAGKEAKAFVQIDWSRGGDACIATGDIQKVEDILGRKSAMMMFSPDHTVFEFMVTNSRLSADEVRRVRRETSFSPDDFTHGRRLFAEGKVDVACLWEPDVTLALGTRPGAHRLFSTADATELVADVLLARPDFLERKPEQAAKVVRAWFAGVHKAEADRPAAARFISSVVPRFRDELGYEQTLAALGWAKWTEMGDNVTFFGLDGSPPAFDRVYNQADSIWIEYPEANIKDRFAPTTLRDDRVVRKVWEEMGRQAPMRAAKYDSQVALTGSPLFTKPITINYRTSDAALDAEAMAILNHQLLPQLQIARGMYIRVEGNTDSVGPEGPNRRLSEGRAQVIAQYLISRGIDKSRIVAKGNGSSRPVASNKTAEGRARNRRTDILFISGAERR